MRMYITNCPVNGQSDEIIFSACQKDKCLIDYINEYKENDLKQDDIEVFKQKDNVLITSNGVYVSFYENQLNIKK